MRKHFEFFAYNSPTDGIFTINGVDYFLGEDFRNVKRYKEYKNAGFTVLMLQHCNGYSGEYWETSACNKCMTEAAKAGIDKVIVWDKRISELCSEEDGLIGEGKMFESEDKLINFLSACSESYSKKSNFYGLLLYDEPRHWMLKSYGQVVKALKKLYPNIYLHCNLLPFSNMDWLADNEVNTRDSFYSYLNKFLNETELKSICVDEYAFRREYIIGWCSIMTFQIMANVARDRGAEAYAVLQSFVHYNGQHLVHRHVTESDMYYQTNLTMGLGFKEFSFFTYFTKREMQISGFLASDGVDGGAFINHDGSRTKLYNFTKRIIGEMKQFEPIIIDYSYVDNYIVCGKGKTYADFPHVSEIEHNEKPCPINVKPNLGVTFISELENKEKNSKMFMVQNISNVKEEWDTGKVMRVNVDLSNVAENSKEINFYFKGKKIDVKLNNKEFNRKLHCGDAIFIEVCY